MLWGTLGRDGSLFEFDPSLTGRGRPLPGRFLPDEAVLELAEERIPFRSIGRATYRLLERAHGWKSRSTRFLLPMGTGEVLVGSDAFLVFHGSLSEMRAAGRPGASAAMRRAFVSPAVRSFFLVRRSDLRAWRQRGRWLELLCLAVSEGWLVPTTKVVLRLRGPGVSELRPFLSSIPEARDVNALDAQFDLRLPSVPTMGFIFLVPVLVALVGFFGSLAIELAFTGPGSPAAAAALAAGFVFLVGGLLAFFVQVARAGRKAKRGRPNFVRVVDSRSLEWFERNTGRLAREFVEAGRRWDVVLDSTMESLGHVPAMEPHLSSRWRPTIYRYAAYLGEVFSRDVASRIHAEWAHDEGLVFLRCRGVGVDLNVLGYAQDRLDGRDPSPPLAKLRAWRGVATLAQSAQPLELFAALGIYRDRILRSPDVLPEIVALARRGGAQTVTRPFGSFVVSRSELVPGVWIQYQTLARDESGERVEEPRSLRPVFEAGRAQEVVVFETFELPSGTEALVVADYGGVPGQPLVLTALATDFLSQPHGSLGPGQRRAVSIGGLAVSGEALPPTPGGPPADSAHYGSISPANPSQPVDPRVRIVGIVHEVRDLPAAFPLPKTVVLDVSTRGLRIPVLADPSRIRGALTPGCGFSGEVWLELQFETPLKLGHGVDVA